jgi:3-hydroxyacyl-[acyl-carrier-protein] dehydratase
MQLDINDIKQRLPHRYPFLLVDRVLSCEPGKSLVAVKNVTADEPYFQGHFPNKPIMPGVLIIEALAQATGILASVTIGHHAQEDSLYYLVAIDRARFRRPVEPGDQLILEVTMDRMRQGIWRFNAVARVGEELVASAVLMTTKKGPAV